MEVSIRRRLAGLAALLLVLASCSARTDRQLQDLYDSGSKQLLLGELDRARELANRGLNIANRQPATAWPWKFRLLLDEIRLIDRRLSEPFPALDESIPEGSEHAWVRARQRFLKGQHHLVRSNLADAIAALDATAALAKSVSATDVFIDAEILKGVAFIRLGRASEGDATLSAAAQAAKSSGDRFREASATMNRGAGYLVRDRYDEALPFFEAVMSMADLSAYMVYAVALRNAGVCYARLGDFDRAIAVERRSVEVNEQRGPRVYLEQALGVLGATYLLKGSYAEAIQYLQRAFDVATAAALVEDAARWADNLTTAHASLGQWDEAERMNREATHLNQRAGTRTFIYNTFHRAEIAVGRGQTGDATKLYEEVLADSTTPPALAWDVHVELGNIGASAGDLNAASRHYRNALDVIEHTRSELLTTDYRLSFLTRLIRFYERYIDVLVERGELDEALTVADSIRARVLAERHGVAAPPRPSAAVFRRAAQEMRSVFVFYWIGSTRSYAWLVTGDRVRFIPLETNAGAIKPLVEQYRNTIVTSLADPLAAQGGAGDTLFQQLVQPVAAAIPRGARVVIVPDGALNILNFETLPVPGDRRHYWIEDVEIVVAPSLGALTVKPFKASASQRSVLLIGDPVPADSKYPSLRYASAEMMFVSDAFGDRASVYRASQATPSQYLASQPGKFGIVHFTAHAEANAESPLDSAVILSRDDNAPAGGYKLYARDVAERPLSADLVTISACRSAGERTYAGEGLVGFAWAFLRAGARRVIAGLWDVDDRSTAMLMGRAYSSLAAGASPSQALRTAKLEMIRSGTATAKPYYWAPFQLFVGAQVVP
jgi:CHAT domain-containing protein/tetratricopeptide (TPR) repeat protein